MPQRNFFSTFSADLPAARNWYLSLFDYRVVFDSDWFVHLQDASNESIEVGIIARDHEIVPEQFRAAPAGGMLTIVVDDVDVTHQQAIAAGINIVELPRDLFFGQRRMLLQDPDGLLVDVSSECEPDPEWLAGLAGGEAADR